MNHIKCYINCGDNVIIISWSPEKFDSAFIQNDFLYVLPSPPLNKSLVQQYPAERFTLGSSSSFGQMALHYCQAHFDI